jgi:hypothetical protein
MASLNPINIRPMFETDRLPCEGRVGDILVISPLPEDKFDTSNRGVASLWICTRADYPQEGVPAVWVRLQADGYASCEYPVPVPPENIEPLRGG